MFEGEHKIRDLTQLEKDYLGQLAQSGGKGEATEEDKAFFRRYYRELQNSPSLFSRWESFILERSVEDSDFLNGLARCIRILRPRVNGKPWKLVVRAKSAKEKDLYHVNEATGTYFAKAVDEEGTVKWTDQYSYDAAEKRLAESRRMKADGTIIQVLYQYSSDGKQSRIVIGPDGKLIPADQQDSFLNQ